MSKKSRATTCISRDNENEGNISIQNYESNAEVSIETMNPCLQTLNFCQMTVVERTKNKGHSRDNLTKRNSFFTFC
jgi:hypothetical protein